MKTRFIAYLVISITLVGIFLLNTSCEKNTETEVTIIAKYLSDTNKVIPFAHVSIGKHDVQVDGATDLNGEFTYTFNIEAILDVVVTKTDETPPLQGETTIRLNPGKSIRKSVMLD